MWSQFALATADLQANLQMNTDSSVTSDENTNSDNSTPNDDNNNSDNNTNNNNSSSSTNNNSSSDDNVGVWAPKLPHHEWLECTSGTAKRRTFRCTVCGLTFQSQITSAKPGEKHQTSLRHVEALRRKAPLVRTASSLSDDNDNEVPVHERSRRRFDRNDDTDDQTPDNVETRPPAPVSQLPTAFVQTALAAVPMADVSTVAQFLIDAQSSSLTIDACFEKFSPFVSLPSGGAALSEFMNCAFFRAEFNDDASLFSSFANMSRAQLDRFHAVGCAWAQLERQRDTRAARIHFLRKIELSFVYGVLETVFRTRQLNLKERLRGAVALRDDTSPGGVCNVILDTLGRRADRFLRFLRSALTLTVPLDAFFAIYGQRRCWYSERQFRLLRSACELGLADPSVMHAVQLLEPTLPAVVCGAPVAVTDDTIVAQSTALQERAVSGNHPKPVNDMCNKWFDVALALFPREVAAAFDLLFLPLFWVAMADENGRLSERLMTVDLRSLPFSLYRIGPEQEPFLRTRS
jgi:hypothetical protein